MLFFNSFISRVESGENVRALEAVEDGGDVGEFDDGFDVDASFFETSFWVNFGFFRHVKVKTSGITRGVQ